MSPSMNSITASVIPTSHSELLSYELMLSNILFSCYNPHLDRGGWRRMQNAKKKMQNTTQHGSNKGVLIMKKFKYNLRRPKGGIKVTNQGYVECK